MHKAVVWLILCLASSLAVTQDLVITNGQILDGAGGVINNGTVAVTDGQIVFVGENLEVMQGTQIDANGMTVLPGFIDTHVHLMDRSATSMAQIEQQIEESLPDEFLVFLEAGFTTVLSTADHDPPVFEVRRQLEEGEMLGPRLLVVGPNFTVTGGHPAVTVCRNSQLCRDMMSAEIDTLEEARRRVSQLASAGADGIKAVYESRDGGPKLSDELLEALADEARVHGLQFIAHIGRGEDRHDEARTAIQMGAARMAHLRDWRPDVIEMIRAAGILVSTTIATQHVTTSEEEAAHARELAGARRLVDAGVTLAYGTDIAVAGTFSLPPAETLFLQTRALREVVSAEEVISILTSNAAQFLDRDDIGSLEPGKVADIVIVDGDPLSDISDLGNIEVVIRDGQVVVDNR